MTKDTVRKALEKLHILSVVYMQIITPVMENSKVFLKIKKSIAIYPEIPLLGMFSKEIKAIHHITECKLEFL